MPTVTPSSTTWRDSREYMLQEDQFFLLQEDGDKIMIRGVGATDWTVRADQ